MTSFIWMSCFPAVWSRTELKCVTIHRTLVWISISSSILTLSLSLSLLSCIHLCLPAFTFRRYNNGSSAFSPLYCQLPCVLHQPTPTSTVCIFSGIILCPMNHLDKLSPHPNDRNPVSSVACHEILDKKYIFSFILHLLSLRL